MKMDKQVKRALDNIPVPYQIVKKTDHYYLVVEGHPRILVAGNHDRIPPHLTTKTIHNINKLITALGDTNERRD